jgi:chemotaxis protein MotB
MARKRHAGAHENHERWLLTYADMITLLVAFFIMLYAMSITSKAKFEVLAISVRSGFNGNEKMQAVPMSPGVGIMQSNAMIAKNMDNSMVHHVGPLNIPKMGGPMDDVKRNQAAQAEQEMMDKIQKQIEDEAKRRGLEDMIKVSQDERGLTVRILTDKLLFAKGDATLQSKADFC